jgi:hypothetical protein
MGVPGRRIAPLRVLRARSITYGFGTHAARRERMARPSVHKLITWCCTIQSSVMLVACLFLPQVIDCHGNERTAFETHTAPLIIALAAIGFVPVLWQWRSLRQPLLLVVGVLAAGVLITSVFGIAVLVVLALARTMTDEEAVALCCFTLALAFVLVFPVAMLFGEWRRGAELAWGAGWLQLTGTMWWAATADRH